MGIWLNWLKVRDVVEVSSIKNIKNIYSPGIVLKTDGTVWKILKTEANYPLEKIEQIPGLNNITSIITNWVGNDLVALDQNGQIWDLEDNYQPALVGSLYQIRSIAANHNSSAALKSDGTIFRWGYDKNLCPRRMFTTNSSSEKIYLDIKSILLAYDYKDSSSEFYIIDSQNKLYYHQSIGGTRKEIQDKNVKSICKVGGVTIILTQEGSVWTGFRENFEQVDIDNVKAIACGVEQDEKNPRQISLGHIIALKNDGTLWSWDLNIAYSYVSDAELGRAITLPRSKPGLIKGVDKVSAITCGANHSLALREDGTVWSWGDSGQFQLGTKSRRVVQPQKVMNLENVTAVACGQYCSYALKNDGTVWAWGDNRLGQLGRVTKKPWSDVPVRVNGLADVTSIVSGVSHCLALLKDGTVWAWGNNTDGQLGNGTIISNNLPVQVKWW